MIKKTTTLKNVPQKPAKKQAEKPYLVNISFNTVFYGAHNEIVDLVENNLKHSDYRCYPEKGDGVEIKIIKEIKSKKDLPNSWDDDSIPFGSINDFMIKDILKEPNLIIFGTDKKQVDISKLTSENLLNYLGINCSEINEAIYDGAILEIKIIPKKNAK